MAQKQSKPQSCPPVKNGPSKTGSKSGGKRGNHPPRKTGKRKQCAVTTTDSDNA